MVEFGSAMAEIGPNVLDVGLGPPKEVEHCPHLADIAPNLADPGNVLSHVLGTVKAESSYRSPARLASSFAWKPMHFIREDA